MNRIEGSDFYMGSRKVGEIRGEILDPRGAKLGSFKGRTIFDQYGRVVGTIRGDAIYSPDGHRITTVADIRKVLSSQGDTSIAALWLLLVK